jgi:hypothetical protein
MTIEEIVERESAKHLKAFALFDANGSCRTQEGAVTKEAARALGHAVARATVEECAKIVWKERMEPMGSYRAINQIRALVADEKEPK